METTANKKANSVMSSEIPASPDAEVSNIQGNIQGAIAFNRAYRTARRQSGRMADEADESLSQVEGAVCAFFNLRPATTQTTLAEFTLSKSDEGARIMRATSRIYVRDEILGKCVVRLSVSVTECGHREAHGSVRSTRWWETSRLMGTFSGYGPEASERMIEAFALWATTQDY
jgi:hypothetical protein